MSDYPSVAAVQWGELFVVRSGRTTRLSSILCGSLVALLTACGGAPALHGYRSIDLVPRVAPTATPGPTPSPTPTPRPTLKPTRPPQKPRANPTTTAKKPAPTPNSGVGVWLLAPGGTDPVGSGTKEFITYRVEVEQATGLNAATVATMVDATLGNTERGWVRGGWGFQRVSNLPLASVGMVVRVATPATVDKICGAAGVNTGGVVSCRTGKLIMINLTRWNVGIPAYASDVNQYRRLVVNHEVGHRLGFGHKTCQQTGEPEAPVMMTQYYGLNGCQPNVWPYRADGSFVD